MESGKEGAREHEAMKAEMQGITGHLADLEKDSGELGSWNYEMTSGGSQNAVYHVDGPFGEYAVKFTIRDERDRAAREFQALKLLRKAGPDIAPRAIMLDRESYEQPVVVQSWEPGEVSGKLPESQEEWDRLIEVTVAMHLVKEQSGWDLPDSVENATTLADAKERVHQTAAKVPREHWPEGLEELIAMMDGMPEPDIGTTERTLCRADFALKNYLRQDDRWLAIDWEFAGWGDPHFDFAELMMHPSYRKVPLEEWDRQIDAYAEKTGDPRAKERIREYAKVKAVWWAARSARFDYDSKKKKKKTGLKKRPDKFGKHYEHYRQLAMRLIAD